MNKLLNKLPVLSRFLFPVLLGLFAWSCVTPQGPTNVPTNFYSSDPVARANGNAVLYSTNGQFDAGVAFARSDNRGSVLTSYAAMAFDKDWIPANVNSAAVNGIPLTWYQGGANNFLPNTYGSLDSGLFGSPDSVTFSYNDFDNDYFSSKAEVAPPFGLIAPPDTVSVSQGFTLRYATTLSTDSVDVTLEALDSLSADSALIVDGFVIPDTGSVTFSPQMLPYTKGGTYLYAVQLYRERFATRTSGSGKHIGIYSNYTTSAVFSVKP